MSDPVQETIRVDVVYADARAQIVHAVAVNARATVEDAVRLSGIRDAIPGDFVAIAYGIFGRVVPADTQLREGDRVELYRPLKIDPKQARRRRADKQKGK